MAEEKEVSTENPVGEAESPQEATKRKFREVLARKSDHASAGGSAQNTAKVHGTHTRAGGKRTFRRRAGG